MIPLLNRLINFPNKVNDAHSEHGDANQQLSSLDSKAQKIGIEVFDPQISSSERGKDYQGRLQITLNSLRESRREFNETNGIKEIIKGLAIGILFGLTVLSVLMISKKKM